MLQVTVWTSMVEVEGLGRSHTSREIIERKTPLAVTALPDPPNAHPADVVTHLR
jgi:hypothetical protein